MDANRLERDVAMPAEREKGKARLGIGAKTHKEQCEEE
jgi:hypothetical protein